VYLNRFRWVLALAGLVFALVGIASENSLIVWSAIAILAVAFALGLYLRKKREREMSEREQR
jgi:Flp pilus assembly protein TadB